MAWMPQLTGQDLRKDLIAGLTVAVVIVPQGMAYAMLTGLPPITGLYAAIVPLAVYGLFGTSRQLSVGPVATVSMLTASGVSALHPSSPEAYLALAIQLALLVGLLQTLMGLFRLGFFVNFLAQPVLSGFTSAVAIIIGLSQVKHLVGLPMPRSFGMLDTLAEVWTRSGQINLVTLGIGSIGVALLLGLRRLSRAFPSALLVVVVATWVVYAAGLSEQGVQIVGEVPAGMPAPRLPSFDLATMQALLPAAWVIALVGYIGSISVAKVFATKNGYEVDANQELVAQGLANLSASLFPAFPVAGGFGRSAVNAEAGATSGLASVISAALVALTIMFLTPLFYYLPKAALAALIVTAVISLVDIAEVRHLWRVKPSDLILLLISFVATLALGLQWGIFTGVLASLVWFVARSTRPHFAVLGRLPQGAYRNVLHHPEAQTHPGVSIVRMDAQFYFGNVTFLKDKLRELEASQEGLSCIIIDASAMNQLDSSADAALHELAQAYRRRGIWLFLAGVKHPVWQVLNKSGFVACYGKGHMFVTVEDAVQAALATSSSPLGSDPLQSEA